MLKLGSLFALITILEVWLASSLALPAGERPGLHEALSGLTVFLMCVGGVESARWLLRRSPAARAAGPESDWVRLWLWLGGPLGLGLVGVLGLSWAISGWLSPKVDLLLMGHFVPGALLWLGGALWAVPELVRGRELARPLTRRLVALGACTHGLGLALYLWVHPGLLRGPWKVDVGVLVTLLGQYQFLFYAVLAGGLAWGLVFRLFWEPVSGAEA